MTRRSENRRFAPRPPVRFDRPRLPETEVEQARRDRHGPRFTQWDYLHLASLRRGLMGALRLVDDVDGPVLDLFCGTKPYLELIPWRPVWGLDLDNHFGRTDVIGTVPLPFRDGAFELVFCSQALYLVDDPVRTVRETARVLRPDGSVIVSILSLFWAESEYERHWSRDDLLELFAGWDDVRVLGVGGPGAAIALIVGRALTAATRRWPHLDVIYRPTIVAVNVFGGVLDAVSAPLARRWPETLVLVARRPVTATG